AQVVNLATTDLTHRIYPLSIDFAAVKRLETYKDYSCDSLCTGACGSGGRMIMVTHQIIEEHAVISSIDLGHLECLRIFNHQARSSIESELSSLAAICKAPVLRGISTYISLLNSGIQLPESLTHLQLDCDQYPKFTLNLPSLKYLHIYTEATTHTQSPEKDSWSSCDVFGLWTFPKLVTFRLGGSITEDEWAHIWQLVLNCSSTIINFVADFKMSVSEPFHKTLQPPITIFSPILNACANLSLFGIMVSSIISSVSNSSFSFPSNHHLTENHARAGPRSLLIIGMGTFGDYKHHEIESFQRSLNNSSILEVLLGPSTGEMITSSFKRIVVPYTWSELNAVWDDAHKAAMRNLTKPFHHPSVLAWVFLKYFIKRGMDVVDEEGVELRDGGMWLLESTL
ncbi:hypothetical protein FRC17_008015, partial [Serendipita sp. 399]